MLCALAGCGAEAATPEVALRFTASTTTEDYLCFGFRVDALEGADIAGLVLDAPTGGVALHHLSLFAAPADFAAGPVECEAMPDVAVPMYVWAIGGTSLVLPPDTQLAVPDGTVSLIVQAHALRTGDDPPAERTLTVTTRRGAAHRAGWMPLRAPVPALRPHHREESIASCVVADELNLISTWPHMHEAGAEFTGSVVGGDAFVDVQPWAYDEQRAYPIDVVLGAGDSIETHCIWENTTDATILPGPLVTNEMCGQSVMAWPVEAAHCE